MLSDRWPAGTEDGVVSFILMIPINPYLILTLIDNSYSYDSKHTEGKAVGKVCGVAGCKDLKCVILPSKGSMLPLDFINNAKSMHCTSPLIAR